MGRPNRHASVRPGEWSSEHPSRERMRVAAEIVALNMRICADCGELSGRFIDPYDRAERIQNCACSTDSPPSTRTPWPRYDFNNVVELCFCCASTAIHSGTLSTPLFCDECLMWVESLNEGEGRTVIPEDRQSATDPASVGLLAVLGRMKAYRLSKIQSLMTMWLGEAPAAGVAAAEYLRRVSSPGFQGFRAFALSVTSATSAPPRSDV